VGQAELNSQSPPKGFFRCPHCRQKTITAWTKLRTRAACPDCGGRFVAGSSGALLAVLVMPFPMFAPMFVLHSVRFPLVWLVFAVGTVLTLAVAGVIYLFATPLYRKGSAAARWDTISFLTLVAGVTVYAVANTDFSREAGLEEDTRTISVGPPVFSRDGVASSVHYGDAATQQALKDALDKAGIPYKLEMRDGEEFVGWTHAHDAAARKIKRQVDGSNLPPGPNVSFNNPVLQKEFVAWLTSKGVKHETTSAYGREHVVWEGPDDLSRQFMTKRPSDCDKMAAAGIRSKRC
jgi:uncharacterized protein (DUF983 family)